MKKNIFTFWEGPMPAYIKLCMGTWKDHFTILDYGNLDWYTDIPIEKVKRFTLPQIADIVRVHVLRDQGGYWLDADTIMVTGQLPKTDLVGYPDERTSSAGLLYSEPGSNMFVEWARHQDEIINSTGIIGGKVPWSTFVNDFSDPYAKEHEEIRIHPISDYWPETYMISENIPRYEKYQRFYFNRQHALHDLRPTDLLMLHNSWTPDWYKTLSEKEVMDTDCTLSNILREVLRTE